MDDALQYITEGLPELLRLIQASDVRELEVCEGEMRVRVRRAPAEEPGELVEEAAEPVLLEPMPPSIGEVVSPLVGTFYRAVRPGEPPFVAEGSRVEEGAIVGIVEALNVLTEVEARCQGTVTRVLATDGQPVQYGQPLFEVSLSE